MAQQILVILKYMLIISYQFLGYVAPFNIYVHTDSQEGSAADVETMNRGFCLDYIQQPCSTIGG